MDDAALLERAITGPGAWSPSEHLGGGRQEGRGKGSGTPEEFAHDKGVSTSCSSSVGSADEVTGIPHCENQVASSGQSSKLGFPSHVILRPVFSWRTGPSRGSSTAPR